MWGKEVGADDETRSGAIQTAPSACNADGSAKAADSGPVSRFRGQEVLISDRSGGEQKSCRRQNGTAGAASQRRSSKTCVSDGRAQSASCDQSGTELTSQVASIPAVAKLIKISLDVAPTVLMEGA